MDTLTAPVAPAPYKDRHGWLIAFGVIEILMGCLCLLMIGMMAFVFLGPVAAKMSAADATPSPFSRPAMLALASSQYVVMATLFFLGGIGSIRCRNWARILMLVVSGLWLGFGVLTTGFMAVLLPMIMKQQRMPAPPSPGILHAVMAFTLVMMIGAGIVIPAIFLFFYSRKSVKATCLARAVADTSDRLSTPSARWDLPVPLTILGGWEAFSAISGFCIVFLKMTIMFGVALSGNKAVLVLLTYAVLSGGSAWYIFHKNVAGWTLALAKTLFWTASMIVSWTRGAKVLESIHSSGFDPRFTRIYEQMPQMFPIMFAGTSLMMAAILVFILYTRKFFPAHAESA